MGLYKGLGFRVQEVIYGSILGSIIGILKGDARILDCNPL